MLEPSGLYYPNRLARAFFVAMVDVMGHTGLNTLLNLAGLAEYIDQPPDDSLKRQFDFAALAALSAALEEMYGTRGGRGMALKIGRASFAQGFKRFGAMRGIGDPAFRALPLDKRVVYGLEALALIFNRFTDQTSHIEAVEGAYLFHVEHSPMAWGRNADKPVCHALVGIIQENLRWASNGYEFYVRETQCRASGGESCVFRVNRTAIGEQHP